jgi:hypothetical protein
MTLFALMLAAAAVGSLHTVAPDHWVPFAALARARNWSSARTARVTLFCGFGHVTVSALLGIVALFIGLKAVHAFGSSLEATASVLLIAFGLAYMLWAVWRLSRREIMHHVDHVKGVPHDHGHGHHHRHKLALTEWSLLLLFSADPCVAVIPMIIAASAIGWSAVAAVIVIYEIATIATMIVLVQTAHAGARAIRMPWLDRYGDVAAGATIVALGAIVTLLGI